MNTNQKFLFAAMALTLSCQPSEANNYQTSPGEAQSDSALQDADFYCKRRLFGIKYPWDMLEPYSKSGCMNRLTESDLENLRGEEAKWAETADRADLAAMIAQAWREWNRQRSMPVTAWYKHHAKDRIPKLAVTCVVKFTASIDGHVTDLSLETPSTDKRFNDLCLKAIESLEQNSVLSFPPAVKDTTVRLCGTFKQDNKAFQYDQQTVGSRASSIAIRST